MSEPCRIARDTWVVLDYALYDDEGELLEATDEDGARPVGFVYGYGALVPGLERGIIGMAAGETREILVPPEEAYGERDPELELWVDRAEFGPEVAPEDEFVTEDASGEESVLRVVEVTEDAVLVDRNHPLAGEVLRFDVIVRTVRPASRKELDRARAGRRPLALPIVAVDLAPPPAEPDEPDGSATLPRAGRPEADVGERPQRRHAPEGTEGQRATAASATPPTSEQLGRPIPATEVPRGAPSPAAGSPGDPTFDDEQ